MRTPVKKKKVPAPKGAELKLESKGRLKAQAIRQSFENTMTGSGKNEFKNVEEIINDLKVKSAFAPSYKNKYENKRPIKKTTKKGSRY